MISCSEAYDGGIGSIHTTTVLWYVCRQMMGLGAAALSVAGLTGCGGASGNADAGSADKEAGTMKYVLQICTGPWDKANYKTKDIARTDSH